MWPCIPLFNGRSTVLTVCSFHDCPFREIDTAAMGRSTPPGLPVDGRLEAQVMSTSSEIAQLRRCFEVLEQQLNQQQQHQTTTGTSPASQHQSVTGPQRQAQVLERLLKQVTASRDELAASVVQLGARCEGLKAQLVQAKSSGEQEQRQALLQQREQQP